MRPIQLPRSLSDPQHMRRQTVLLFLHFPSEGGLVWQDKALVGGVEGGAGGEGVVGEEVVGEGGVMVGLQQAAGVGGAGRGGVVVYDVTLVAGDCLPRWSGLRVAAAGFGVLPCNPPHQHCLLFTLLLDQLPNLPIELNFLLIPQSIPLNTLSLTCWNGSAQSPTCTSILLLSSHSASLILSCLTR